MPQTIRVKTSRLLFMVLLSVSACEHQPAKTSVNSITIKPAPTVKTGKAAPVKTGKVAPVKTGKVAPVKTGATSASITEKLPEPIPPPKVVKIPKVLIGLTRAEILDIFGPPVFIRKDPPAEFWRYQSQSCVLEVFLYAKNDDLRVDYVNTRPKGSAPTTLSQCIPNSQKHG